MSRKGISPIIASVLLLAVSLAVVGIFSGWAPSLAQDVTERTENSTMETIACNEASLNIESAYYNSSSGDTTVSLRNTGDGNLPAITLVAYDDNEQIMNQKTDVNLPEGNITDAKITSLSSPPSYIEAYSTSCGSVTDRIDSINQ